MADVKRMRAWLWGSVLLALGAVTVVNVLSVTAPTTFRESTFHLRRDRASGAAQTPSEFHLPEIRPYPRSIAATQDFRDQIDSHALADILNRVRPFSPKPMVSVLVATHAMRLWGTDAQFEDRSIVPEGFHYTMWQFSSPTMIAVLLDGRRFAQMYPNGESLLQRSSYGISVRLKVSRFGERPITRWPDCEAHVDKLVSVLGEVGLPKTHPVHTLDYNGTVSDLLHDSLARFVLTQELEFSSKAFLYYLQLPATWRNRYGDEIRMASILGRVANGPLGKGACVGTHRCQVLALALHFDAQSRFLSQGDRQLLVNYLCNASHRLESSQRDDGGWPPDWLLSGDAIPLAHAEGVPATMLRVTGHHLEWIAIAPESVRPSPESIRRAIHFLQKTMENLPADNYYHNYSLLTHGARALVLLSGCDPTKLLQDEGKVP